MPSQSSRPTRSAVMMAAWCPTTAQDHTERHLQSRAGAASRVAAIISRAMPCRASQPHYLSV